ncbi:MAG: hypothetical protein ABSE45_10165 [Candidatus Acidiferrales bacterium]|jgi:hypothetical protein
MRKAARMLVICGLVFLPGISVAQGRFDGNWHTKLTCPAKGNTEGYTWVFPSVIQNNNFRGEHGTAGEPGYLLIEGKIAENGSAKLSATGIVASRKYARGVFAHQGGDYSYDIKAQFKETEGTGTRNEGLGIVGRPCTFEFVKQQATSQDSGPEGSKPTEPAKPDESK